MASKLRDVTTNSFYQNLLTNCQLILSQLFQNNVVSMSLWYNPLIIKSVLHDKSMLYNGCTYIADVARVIDVVVKPIQPSIIGI